ncbi:MAG: hypothetical protein HAW60_02510 [Bdellovibrionales bacterium]|nr:hypothetical protein [Bdellovibrionales bacterium]
MTKLFYLTLLFFSSCNLIGLKPLTVVVHKPIHSIFPALSKVAPINKIDRTNVRVFVSEYFRITKREEKIKFIKIFSYDPKPTVRYKLKFNISGDRNPYTLFVVIVKEKKFISHGKRVYESVEVSEKLKEVVKKVLTSHLGKRSKSFNLIDDFRVF